MKKTFNKIGLAAVHLIAKSVANQLKNKAYSASQPVLIRIVVIIVSFIPCTVVFSNVTLPRLISDGIVLQRNKEIKVWGWADPGEKVSVEFLGKIYSATTSADKKWQTAISPQKGGGPYLMTIKGTNTITINDVLVGDVWLCSGQSNMAYLMERSKQRYTAEIASSTNNFIRQFSVKSSFNFHEQDDFKSDGWISASPATVLSFTAVGYFFAKEIYDLYKIPVGLINSSIGGTPAEAWISEEGLQSLPDYLNQYRFYQNPENLQEAQQKNRRVQDSLKGTANRVLPVKLNHQPASLYNSMIAPLIQFSIQGVLWYQGEANVRDPYPYRKLFPALINDWRNKFKQGNLPFLYVQLANYGKLSKVPEENKIAVLREAQAMALLLPNTGMAVIHDAGEADGNIHPTDKKTVGYRLSLIARNIVYGENNLVHSGPVYKSMKTSGSKITLAFTNTGGGLITKDGKDPGYFAIAGADKKFVWASARIEGDKIVVWSNEVMKPVAVRYAWAGNPAGCNLYNKEGLPASLFRTDHWDTEVLSDDEGK